MPLDIKAKFEDLKKSYEVRGEHKNFLVYGNTGSGKSHSLATAPRPLLIHSFDPGGCNLPAIKKGVDDGSIIVDTRWENEDPRNPFVYKDWMVDTSQLIKEKIFGTIFKSYAIDSVTNWVEAMWNFIQKSENKLGQTGELQQYMKQQIHIRDHLKILCNLPCHTVFLGHMELKQDETTMKFFAGLMVSGKLQVKMPLMFDEVYIAEANPTPKGTEFVWRMKPEGVYRNVRTRMGSGIFESTEKQDFTYLLHKAGVIT